MHPGMTLQTHAHIALQANTGRLCVHPGHYPTPLSTLPAISTSKVFRLLQDYFPGGLPRRPTGSPGLEPRPAHPAAAPHSSPPRPSPASFHSCPLGYGPLPALHLKEGGQGGSRADLVTQKTGAARTHPVSEAPHQTLPGSTHTVLGASMAQAPGKGCPTAFWAHACV